MPDQQELEQAIAQRLIDNIAQGATSDTVLKLAEAWAWIHSPDQAHGGIVNS